MNKLLVILGPTSTGKSDLSVDLALKFDGEIISTDSRQVYRRMDLGTGKITEAEMRGVPHYLLDVIEPTERFSVAEFQELAEHAITDIQFRHKLPILCGGTGLYIKSITASPEYPKVAPNYELREDLDTWETADLAEELKRLDPRRHANIDLNNRRRLIRAIEIAKELGVVPEEKQSARYDTLFIGLELPAEVLRERIATRLQKRVDSGMLDEVQKLRDGGVSWEKIQRFGLEYKYCALYLQKQLSLHQMRTRLENEIWQYAKRQMTWFKKYAPDTKWFRPEQREEIEETVSGWYSKI
ncbi:MAG: tRNA (adenosine(37)-N6)-dimethylallyltransferase MiaA [Candidatus Vogelbacteria bacterium]|nr:tRNA (adenosine(37)-N6)-dimethylallyltransferase MiaA [Candidatus Vogelbacteria bacterium]